MVLPVHILRAYLPEHGHGLFPVEEGLVAVGGIDVDVRQGPVGPEVELLPPQDVVPEHQGAGGIGVPAHPVPEEPPQQAHLPGPEHCPAPAVCKIAVDADVEPQGGVAPQAGLQLGVQGVEPLEDEAGVLVEDELRPVSGGSASGGEVEDGEAGPALLEQLLHAPGQSLQVQALDALEVLLAVLPGGDRLAVLVEVVQGDAAGATPVPAQPRRQQAGRRWSCPRRRAR